MPEELRSPRPVDALFDAFHGCWVTRQLYEQLLWLGLENAVYQREIRPNRPALPALRRRYARRVIARQRRPYPTEELPTLLEEMPTSAALLGEEAPLMPRERDMLGRAGAFRAIWSGQELTERRAGLPATTTITLRPGRA